MSSCRHLRAPAQLLYSNKCHTSEKTLVYWNNRIQNQLIMSIDPGLAVQLGAGVGCAFALYGVSRPAEAVRQAVEEQRKNQPESNFVSGAKRYSPLHRQQSLMGRNNLSSDVLHLQGRS